MAGFDAVGRTASRTTPNGVVTTYGYDGRGLLKTVTSPRGNVPGANPADFTTTYFYDADDNPIRVRRPYPGGSYVDQDIDVDALDRTTGTVDELGKTSTFGRDNIGNITTTDTLGRTTSMGYDRNGQQTAITDAAGKVTRTEYDEAGNHVREIDPLGRATRMVYDDAGRPGHPPGRRPPRGGLLLRLRRARQCHVPRLPRRHQDRYRLRRRQPAHLADRVRRVGRRCARLHP